VSITVKGFTVILSPLKTPAQQGSAVPIIWQLKDADGNLISSLSTLLKMESVFNGPAPASGCVASATGVRETLFSLPNGATGSSSFRFVSPATSSTGTPRLRARRRRSPKGLLHRSYLFERSARSNESQDDQCGAIKVRM
jgi:hypothetical protein